MVTVPSPPTAVRLSRFILVSADAERLSRFYEQAFGCRRVATTAHHGEAFERAMGVTGGGFAITLALGRQRIDLLQFDHPGRAYPAQASASDLSFQHLALVVSTIDSAYAALSRMDGWKAITTGGPQRLPASSGGVAAFKFRDPEGHPLELLAFPPDKMPAAWRDVHHNTSQPFLGIDHSAISVSDTARSTAFYQALGLTVSGGSLNVGAEQGRLDGLADPHVDVTALVAPQATPHLELLAYRHRDEAAIDVRANDVAATRVVWQVRSAFHAGGQVVPLSDPNGHRLLLESA